MILEAALLTAFTACARAERIEVPARDPAAVRSAVERAKPGDVIVIKTSGNAGPGLRLKTVGIWPEIDTVEPGSPAEKAGLRPGDQLRAIDGAETLGVYPAQLEQRVIGRPGTQAKLSVSRGGAPAREVSLDRSETSVVIHDDVDRGYALLLGGDAAAAFKVWKPLARSGNARAQAKLGGVYYFNLASRDFKEELYWRTKAAEQGSIDDMKMAALYHRAGNGCKKDDAEAFQWYLKAAEAGDMDAMFEVGDAYREGRGAPMDGRRAADWFRKASDSGHSGAANWLAGAYEGGWGVTVDKVDKKEAQRYAALASVRGLDGLSPTVYYGEEGGLAKDDPLAVAGLRARALRKNNPKAKFRLGQAYLLGETGARDAKEAVMWFKAAAEEGSAEAMNAVGWVYARGEGIDADPAQALSWFQKALEKNAYLMAARNNLGWLYFQGEGVDKDEKKAWEQFRSSCLFGAAGVVEGCYNAGLLAERGLGTPRSEDTAFEEFKLGAEHGDAWCQVKTGQAAEKGTGTLADPAASLEWYRKAANQGNSEAQRQMGRLYEVGLGVSKDAREAAKWYKRAAQATPEPFNGNFALRLELDLPAEKRPDEDLAALKRLAAAEPKRAQAQRPRVSSDVDSPSFHQPERPDDFALVIGVEQYPDLPAASFAERDAAAVRDYLLALGVPRRNLIYLTGAQASRGGLVKNLETWLPMNVKPDSRVYFYFSGHGAPDPVSGQAFLVPSDGDAQFLQDTAYPVKRLYEKLQDLKAAKVVAALDSCFSGAGGRSVLAKGARPLVTVAETGTVTGGKLVVLSASAAREISGTDEEHGHGLFTYFLLKGLNGAAADARGRVSVGSLHRYLRPQVMDEARRLNRSQTPQLMPDDAQAGETTLR